MTDLKEPGSHAILLGASSYESDQLADVPAVVDTVNDLRTALIDRESITDLRGPDRCASGDGSGGQGGAAHQGHPRRPLRRARAHRQRGDLYLSVGGTDPAPEYGQREHTAISYAEIARELAKSPALAIVVILDCCSGRALPRDDPAGGGPGLPTGPKGGLVIASAAREEHAIARERDKYTAFTGQLLHHTLEPADTLAVIVGRRDLMPASPRLRR